MRKRDYVVHIVLYTLCCWHCKFVELYVYECCLLVTGVWGYSPRVQTSMHASMPLYLSLYVIC